MIKDGGAESLTKSKTNIRLIPLHLSCYEGSEGSQREARHENLKSILAPLMQEDKILNSELARRIHEGWLAVKKSPVEMGEFKADMEVRMDRLAKGDKDLHKTLRMLAMGEKEVEDWKLGFERSVWIERWAEVSEDLAAMFQVTREGEPLERDFGNKLYHR
jgi:hypothetical protein